jgi:hypothetical protein
MSACCPGHDPLLAAGTAKCHTCGAVNYPVAAEWMSGTLILAAFDPAHRRGCANRGHPVAVLLDVGAADTGYYSPARPRRCRGTAATTGQPCRAYAMPGSGYCHSHDPAKRRTP